MDVSAVLDARRSEAMAMHHEAEVRVRSLRMELRAWKMRLAETAAEVALLDVIARDCNGDASDIRPHLRPSARIAECLSRRPDGMVLAEFREILSDLGSLDRSDMRLMDAIGALSAPSAGAQK